MVNQNKEQFEINIIAQREDQVILALILFFLATHDVVNDGFDHFLCGQMCIPPLTIQDMAVWPPMPGRGPQRTGAFGGCIFAESLEMLRGNMTLRWCRPLAKKRQKNCRTYPSFFINPCSLWIFFTYT